MRLLSERDVRDLLTPDIALDAAALAYRIISAGEAEVPLRTEFLRQKPEGVILVMPGLIGERMFGLKLIANRTQIGAAACAVTTAVVLLMDAESLAPLALVSADYLTDTRTAAGIAVATDVLAKADANTHAVFGAGKLSLPSILLVSQVRPIERVILVSRTRARVEQLAERLRGLPDSKDLRIETNIAADEAAHEADIITTVTTSVEPVFDGALLRAGTHVNLGGAFQPTAREMDDVAAARASFYVDSLEACRTRAGDIVQPLESGVISEAAIKGEIGAVLGGTLQGRADGTEITVFKSLGHAVQDLVLADALTKLAMDKDQGTTFNPEVG